MMGGPTLRIVSIRICLDFGFHILTSIGLWVKYSVLRLCNNRKYFGGVQICNRGLFARVDDCVRYDGKSAYDEGGEPGRSIERPRL